MTLNESLMRSPVTTIADNVNAENCTSFNDTHYLLVFKL